MEKVNILAKGKIILLVETIKKLLTLKLKSDIIIMY